MKHVQAVSLKLLYQVSETSIRSLRLTTSTSMLLLRLSLRADNPASVQTSSHNGTAARARKYLQAFIITLNIPHQA